MTGDPHAWPVRPPDAPAFVPYDEATDAPAPPDGAQPFAPPPVPREGSLSSIVALAVSLAVATGAVGLLVLGLVSSIGTGGGGIDDDRFGPPGAPITAPSTMAPRAPTTVAPAIRRSPALQACALVTLSEASVVLGQAAVTVVPAPQISATSLPSCGFSATGRPGPTVPHLQVLIADEPQFLAAKGAAPGTDTFTTERTGTLPRTIEVGLLRDGRGVLLQVVGSTFVDGGADAAALLAETAHARL